MHTEQNNQLISDLKTHIINLEHKDSSFLLHPKRSNNFRKEQLSIEHLLIMKLLITNTLDPPIPCY